MKTKLQNLKEQAADYAEDLRRSGQVKSHNEGLDRFATQLGFGRYDQMIQDFIGKDDSPNLDSHLQRSEALKAEFLRNRPQDKSEFGGQFTGKSAEEIMRTAQNQGRSESQDDQNQNRSDSQNQEEKNTPRTSSQQSAFARDRGSNQPSR